MKKMVFVVSCVAIAIAGVFGVSEFKSEELANCDLLMENVEALARGEVGSSKGCSTSITYVNEMIKCPSCKTNYGRAGTLYSCRSNGEGSTCQSGFSGSETYCNCSHRPKEPVNNVQTFSCSN